MFGSSWKMARKLCILIYQCSYIHFSYCYQSVCIEILQIVFKMSYVDYATTTEWFLICLNIFVEEKLIMAKMCKTRNIIDNLKKNTFLYRKLRRNHMEHMLTSHIVQGSFVDRYISIIHIYTHNNFLFLFTFF